MEMYTTLFGVMSLEQMQQKEMPWIPEGRDRRHVLGINCQITQDAIFYFSVKSRYRIETFVMDARKELCSKVHRGAVFVLSFSLEKNFRKQSEDEERFFFNVSSFFVIKQRKRQKGKEKNEKRKQFFVNMSQSANRSHE